MDFVDMDFIDWIIHRWGAMRGPVVYTDTDLNEMKVLMKVLWDGDDANKLRVWYTIYTP